MLFFLFILLILMNYIISFKNNIFIKDTNRNFYNFQKLHDNIIKEPNLLNTISSSISTNQSTPDPYLRAKDRPYLIGTKPNSAINLGLSNFKKEF